MISITILYYNILKNYIKKNVSTKKINIRGYRGTEKCTKNVLTILTRDSFLRECIALDTACYRSVYDLVH